MLAGTGSDTYCEVLNVAPVGAPTYTMNESRGARVFPASLLLMKLPSARLPLDVLVWVTCRGSRLNQPARVVAAVPIPVDISSE